jgi:hypothetical protein
MFEIIRVQKKRKSILQQSGEALLQIKMYKSAMKIAQKQLQHMDRKLRLASEAEQLISTAERRMAITEVVHDEDQEINQLVEELAKLNSHIAAASQYNELLREHKFIERPTGDNLVVVGNSSRIKEKLRRIKRHNERLKRRISSLLSLRPFEDFDVPQVQTVSGREYQRSSSSDLEFEIERRKIGVDERRFAVEKRRKRLMAIPEYLIDGDSVGGQPHLCDRCNHRFERYELGGKDWQKFLAMVRHEIDLWHAAPTADTASMTVWNNQLEHFMRSVAK